ncbi:hypothetical protein G6F22_015076 [Rhizopus arrhizus]|nr:hypothetical protein G6F22_015076 [Rhizopus arrhizus]KAG1165452.1 hypothetical protein G6F35_018768 [Rhizopus arrhizus]
MQRAFDGAVFHIAVRQTGVAVRAAVLRGADLSLQVIQADALPIVHHAQGAGVGRDVADLGDGFPGFHAYSPIALR